MPQNNEIIARLEGERVIEATLKYPQQGIQTQLDKVYLWNPDVDGAVSHDETLKGDGTTGDPLGLSDGILIDIDSRVEKTDEADKIYGTDSQGNQTTYDKDTFGKVDDVRVDGVSVVENKIADIDLTGKQDVLTPGKDIAITKYPVVLPEGYTLLEYVESTGTQYIDTGVVYSDVLNARIELDAIMRDTGVRGIGRSGSYFGGPFVGLQSGGKFGYSAGNGDQVSTVDGMSDVRYKYDLNIPANSYIVKDENGNTLVNLTSLTKATRSETPACILFGYYGNPNTGDGPNKLRSMRIYSCKMYDNGTLVRDFIPALDANNVPCMFDKVEGKCYYNAGTGQFIAPYLPAEYEKLDYIESTGTQYIDTGFKPNQDSGIEIDFYADREDKSVIAQVRDDFSSQTYDNFVFGITQNSSNTNTKMLLYNSTSAGYWAISSLYGNGTGRYKATVDKLNANIVASDGSTVTYTFSSITAQSRYSLYLFAFNNTGNIAGYSKIKIYSCKLYDNGTPVADFVPARRISDGEIGMYDVIRRQFFTNAGTGSFTCDSSYTELEYIQSSETQYIDTGVVGDLNTEYEITVKNNYTYSTGAYAIFGSRTSATENNIMSTFTSSGGNMGIINDFGDYTVTRQIQMRTSAEIMHRYKLTNGKSKRTVTDLDTGWTDTITTEYSGSLTTPTNLYIGYAGSLGALPNANNLRGNIYGCKIWKSGALVRDFVPAKRNGDNAIGLYDKVSKKFYTNAGTGVFTAGSEIPTPIEPLPIELMVDGTVEKVMITQQEIPTGYLPLEYIESTRTQYIDTGFKANNNTRAIADVMATDSSSGNWAFGHRTSGTSSDFYNAILTNSSINTNYRSDFGSQAQIETASVSLLNRRVVIDKNKNVQTIYDNGTVIGTATNTSATFTSPNNLYLFACNQNGTTVGWSAIKMYSCKLYDNDTLVRDFIPAKRLSDNVLGMLDLVNNVFYTNAGTGTFTAGPEIDTAICENLFATQTLKDEQEILSGDIVCNVGIAVLTGQENWTTENTWFKADVFTGNSMDNAIVCSHFERGLITQDNTVARSAGTTVMMLHYSACANVAALKSWLASQYNAGTPVIVLYALETPTTESVAGQTLNVVEGDNYAEIMQASIDGLEIEAKYIKEM